MVTEPERDERPAAAITTLGSHPAPYVTIDAFATYLTVDRRTVMKWIEAGTLPAYQFHGSSRGTWRIKTTDAIAFEERARFASD